jgi:DNA-binding NarL/FixJ family response regulator
MKDIKILLVEDNPGDVLLLQEALRLQETGEFNLIHEGNLEGALKRLLSEQVDIVLLDLFLPDAHGLEALAQVYQTDSKTPIIALTGFYDERTTLHALKFGAQDYISKDGLDGKKLMKLLRYYAGRERTRLNVN